MAVYPPYYGESSVSAMTSVIHELQRKVDALSDELNVSRRRAQYLEYSFSDLSNRVRILSDTEFVLDYAMADYDFDTAKELE